MLAFTVAGVAIQWGRWGKPGRNDQPAMLFRAGGFRLDRPVDLLLWHDTSKSFASTRDGSMKVWTDVVGLYFEASLDPTRKSLWIINKIRNNYLIGASVGMADDCQVVDRDQGEEVISGTLREISFTSDPAQPGTSIWVQDEHPADLPEQARIGRELWMRSRRQPTISARSIRPPAAVLIQIHTLLALARPVACSPAKVASR